jgi:phosphate acetyltransferase
MEPRHLLAALRHEATLVVTSGDRESILLTLACVQASRRRSGLAGVVLTGGLLPDDAILALIRDMEIPRLPVLAVRDDAFEAAARIRGLHVRLGAGDRERADLAAAGLAQALDRDAILAGLAVAPPRPRTAVGPGPSGFLAQLLARAREARAHIVLPEGDEPRTLEAVARVLAEKVARVTLLGDAETIAKDAAALGMVAGNELAILDPRRSPDLDRYADVVVDARQHRRGGVTKGAAREWLLASTVQFGSAMVRAGDADGLVSGAVHSTADTVRPALQVIGVRPDVGVASSVFFMALADRVLVYGDCAIVPDPNPRELAAITLAAARTARAFGVEPRVALLSYSTGASGAGRSVDKVGEAMAILRERDLDFPVDGPMQYDAAVDPDVARLKLPGSPVAGRATVFVFPDLDAGNIAYKAVQRTAGALAIGPILQGLNRPVNDLSRGCSAEDIVYTIAATAIQARAGA